MVSKSRERERIELLQGPLDMLILRLFGRHMRAVALLLIFASGAPIERRELALAGGPEGAAKGGRGNKPSAGESKATRW